MAKIKSFVIDSRGGIISLQIGTLLVLFGMFYTVITWKRDIEEAIRHPWSAVHMYLWAAEFEYTNPQCSVPDVRSTVDSLNQE